MTSISEAKKRLDREPILEEDSQKETLFSVLMVGAFIALMFAGVFWLYMSRI